MYDTLLMALYKHYIKKTSIYNDRFDFVPSVEMTLIYTNICVILNVHSMTLEQRSKVLIILVFKGSVTCFGVKLHDHFSSCLTMSASLKLGKSSPSFPSRVGKLCQRQPRAGGHRCEELIRG